MKRLWSIRVLLQLLQLLQGKHFAIIFQFSILLFENPNTRALYIFPTKALAQDQKSEINELIQEARFNY